MFVCLFVCLLFIGHTTFVHFAAPPPSTPRAAKPSRAAPRARGQACMHSAESTRAHAVQLLNEKIAALMPFKNKYARAHTVVYVTAEIFKKREKENQHATSQVQFTVCLLFECLLFESYWIVLDLWSEPTLVSSCIYTSWGNTNTFAASTPWPSETCIPNTMHIVKSLFPPLLEKKHFYWTDFFET